VRELVDDLGSAGSGASSTCAGRAGRHTAAGRDGRTCDAAIGRGNATGRRARR